MPAEQADKTEPATPKRREDARRKGQVAMSRELQSVVLLAAAVLLLRSGLGERLGVEISRLTEVAWSGTRPGSLADFHAALLGSLGSASLALVPFVVLLALAGAAAAFVQVGPLLSWEAVKPRGDRMSPIQGFKRMFDLDRLFDLVKALFKVAIVGSLGYWILAAALPKIISLHGAPLEAGLSELADLALRFALSALAFLALMAGIDLLYQRWRYDHRLKMSKKEVRDELKDREGNPQVRSRARALQRELTRSRMIASVAEASVVVTNPTHFAVALLYSPENPAPTIVAKGRNHVAQRIREVARENGVPIVENKPLAQLLHRTGKVGREIPESLFRAVAEVLAYVYRLDPRRAEAWGART